MLAHDFVDAALEGGSMQRYSHAQGGGNVVHAGAGLETIEEPEPLLGERQGKRAVPRRLSNDRRLGAFRTAALRLLDDGHESRQIRRFKETAQRHFEPK